MILLLVSCTSQGYETVEIMWKESQNGQIMVRGMGVRLSDDSILTSAHVVRDDRLIYEISGIRYQVTERDMTGDRAILEKREKSGILPHLGGARGGTPNIPLLNSNTIPLLTSPKWGGTKVQKWDQVFTEVSRSGSIVRIAGKVVDPVWSVTGYDMTGRVITLSGIVLTDIDLQPWDSGAPIFTTQWEIVDVVHVR